MHRWRELRLEQQEILDEVLNESSADNHPRPLCALLRDTKSTSCLETSGPFRGSRMRIIRLAVFNCSLIVMTMAFVWFSRDLPVGWRWCCLTVECFVWVVVASQNPASQANRNITSGAHSSAPSSGAGPSLGTQAIQSSPGSSAASATSQAASATSQAGGNISIQPTSANSQTTQSSLVNNSAYNKQLWVNFGVDGSWTSTELDQLGGLHLVSDAAFLRNLSRRHHEIRGWFRHYFSFRIISYWEFLRFKRLPLLPPQTIDVEADLPTSSDYEYDPRPPRATRDKPGITKHEFEVYVRLCLDPCWLSSLLIPHKCRTVGDSAVDIVDKIPKYKKLLEQRAQGDEHVWGIRARYVVSGVRVVALHIAILCISFGVWIWWQWKHPDDLQGAAVALTAAFLLISTFWSATGVLRDLR
jgi:hypothetical protein